MEGKDIFKKFKIINFSKSNTIMKSDISKAYQANGIDISERELNEMVAFMTGNDKSEDLIISKDDLKKFYIS